MTARQPRFALLGAVLAFVALFGLATLSGWHSAAAHDHAPAHAASFAHPHDGSDRDSNSPIHLTAHATGQWLAPAGHAFVEAIAPATRPVWATVASVPGGSFAPSNLLRPPRA